MTNREMSNLTIENNQAAQRWEAHVDQHLAVAEYRRRGNTIFFIHTEVPHELEGQGVASKLIKTALDDTHAQHLALEGQGVASKLFKTALDDTHAQHLAVVPFCPFVAGYIRRHPDYKALVHPDYRDLVGGEPSQAPVPVPPGR